MIDVEMQCDMLFIVSSLCEGDNHRKVSKNGVTPKANFDYITLLLLLFALVVCFSFE